MNMCGGPPLFPSQCKVCGAGILLHPTCNSSLADTLTGLPSMSSINRVSYIVQKNTKEQHFPLQSLQISSQPLSFHFSAVYRIVSEATSSCYSCASACTPSMLLSETDIALGNICVCAHKNLVIGRKSKKTIVSKNGAYSEGTYTNVSQSYVSL